MTEVIARAAIHRALGEPARLAIVDALAVSDRTPSEVRSRTGLEWNLLEFHLRALVEAGVVERRRSEGDGRRRYLRLRSHVLDDLLVGPSVGHIGSPLFVCTHNSARSQFAAALWHKVTGTRAASAGSNPARAVHPLAVTVARDHGVDLSRARPRGYDEIGSRPDLVVTVCDRALEAGLPFAGERIHWSVPDPIERDRASFEAAFADIAERLTGLIETAP